MSNARNLSKLAAIANNISTAFSKSATTPTGVVKAFAGSAAPSGYLLCYGQAVSRTTYADLFAVTGTTYGVGDGSTTFNVPDLRGRVPAGKDNMGGTAANRLTTISNNLGTAGGAETHTLAASEMPAHSHAIHFKNAGTAGSSSGLMRSNSGTDDGASQAFADSAGGGSAHNNIQPSIVLNYIIKT